MHIEAVIGSAELADCVHGDDGISNVDRANAVGRGKHRADGRAAARIAVVVKGLIGNALTLADRLEDGRAARRGCVGLAVIDLEHGTSSKLDLDGGILQSGIGGVGCVRLVCRKENRGRKCAVFILGAVAKLLANAIDDLHQGIAARAAIGGGTDFLVVKDERDGISALGVSGAKTADDGVCESTVVEMRNRDEFLLGTRKASGGDIIGPSYNEALNHQIFD